MAKKCTPSDPILRDASVEISKKKLVAITDLLGRPVKETNNQFLLYIYDDGSVSKKILTNKIK